MSKSPTEIYDMCRLSGGEFRNQVIAAIVKAHGAPSGHSVAVLLDTDEDEFSLSGYLSQGTTVGRGPLVDVFHFSSWSIQESEYADFEENGYTEPEAVANYAEDIADNEATKALATLQELARDYELGY